MKAKTNVTVQDQDGNSSKQLLCDVNLILLYDYNVIAKEIKLSKWKAIIRGLLWEYNFLHLKRRFLITDVICCGNLEKMDLGWMVTEDGVKLMPFIDGEKMIKYRVNNCPCCGAYVRDCTIQP